MTRFILWVCLLMVVGTTQAQNRIQVANFTQYKHYFNPSLTGHEGAVLKSVYRNQWTGFEDAPKTIMASVELDLQKLGRAGKPFANSHAGRETERVTSAKHGLGLALFHDQFGPSKETQTALSYGAGVRLSEKLGLRWGTALTYTFHRLDGNSLTVDQKNDPRFSDMLVGENRSGRADINLGVSLTGEDFYLGYAMLDATEGKLSSGDSEYLKSFYARRHVGQLGFRKSITTTLGLSFNAIYQSDNLSESTIEGQLKAIYDNLFWVSGGYRNDLAYTLGAGLRLSQLAIGYTYETPTQDARAIDKPTNEVTLSYHFSPIKRNNGRRPEHLMVW